ncbi:MAG: hypothetical protein KDB50_10570 [Mycobacterium sp.]|nr:hypothetical protein [Mycobacterium sp.]
MALSEDSTPDGMKIMLRRTNNNAPATRSEIGVAGHVEIQSNAVLNRWLTAVVTACPMVGASAPQHAAQPDPEVAPAIGPLIVVVAAMTARWFGNAASSAATADDAPDPAPGLTGGRLGESGAGVAAEAWASRADRSRWGRDVLAAGKSDGSAWTFCAGTAPVDVRRVSGARTAEMASSDVTAVPPVSASTVEAPP